MTDPLHRLPASGGASAPSIPRKNDVLAEICRAIARSADHDEVAQECAARLQRYFGTHSVALFFEREGELVLTSLALPDHARHLDANVRAQWAKAPPDDARPSVQAMRLRRIVRRDADDASLPSAMRDVLRAGGASAVIAVPIYADGVAIGACVVVTPGDQPLDAADECLLEDALAVVGIVYQRGVQRVRELDHQRSAIESHNLAVVGELAAGVAHQINNPLSTIVHFAELLLDAALPPEQREQVEAILEEALRAAGTVRNLQTFARQESASADEAARVEDALVAIADLERQRLANSNVELRVELPDDLPPVRIAAASLRRVLHNLIANAREAIHATRRSGEIVVRAGVEGPWARIVVQDTGTGLTPQVAEAMFQPFFTTKAPGEGSGLGLAVAYGMVREQGGHVEAENWGRPPAVGGHPGEGGVRITVWLPVQQAARPRAPRGGPEPRLAGAAQSLSVLIVEDEPQVARSVGALLMREGHRVQVASSAEEAVERLSGEGADFDVLLSDYRMPGMGGEGLFEWLRAGRPEWLPRLVFMSGDLLSARTQAFLESTGRPVLAKPFTLDALRGAIAPLAR